MDETSINHLRLLFSDHFGEVPPSFVVARAPGRVELAGNHTDHQGGRVISTAIARSTYCIAAPQAAPAIDIYMEGYGYAHVALDESGWHKPVPAERNTSQALVRGMASQLADAGTSIGGCRMASFSDVPVGSGLSSSAAFEVAIGAALRGLFVEESSIWENPADIALAAADTEKRFFGKPCGSQDQLASALGGIVFMDFAGYPPRTQHIDFDVAQCGHALYLVDCHCDHSQFTDDFAAITADMHDVAQAVGKQRLRDVAPDRFFARVPQLREQLGDAKVLRALHYFDEDERVLRQVQALKDNDMDAFLRDVRQSGHSSAQFLQNITRGTATEDHQPARIALAACAHALDQRGAYRIHGGGFGGGVLAFVPDAEEATFTQTVNALFGYEACLRLYTNQPGVQVEHFQT